MFVFSQYFTKNTYQKAINPPDLVIIAISL
jgi:hypothetical protein